MRLVPVLVAVLAACLATASPARAADELPFSYVVFIGRSLDGCFFECKRLASDTGFVTDPEVAGYYPYRLARGDEHYFVLSPAEAMPLYWLAAE